ncbi:rhodanese-like domain-containing protein [Streptomonospora sp. S1-112]|uniref:Rhodanese-like domain-containing protein n=1 Tax=Streptomonospora mangrovi TaxID=2883123 RepID=A0A9X3NVQ5_9ACTN|nr:rhodanese-like domain-containing protein [Streptomonospora mangrovi]MDA0567785.1 rhodanese-like domain-containing protein [Streptomonospora mangrovi]
MSAGAVPQVSAVARLLERRRARLVRLTPREAARARAERGALLVDIRPEADRAAEGAIPGAVVVERNVLEWRLDPTSPDRLPGAAGAAATPVVLFCNEGYASSLAAADLLDLGRPGATDMVGGFRAWAAEGLPVAPPGA